jgi:hypothetical protein
MAKKFSSKVNVEEGKFAVLNSSGYDAPVDLSGLQTSEYAPVVASAALYGDGAKLDESNEITSATLTDVTAGEPDTTVAILNGNTTETDGSISEGVSDNPPVVGRSYIAKTRQGGEGQTSQTGYTAYFCPRVRYAPIAGGALTAKTDSISYSTDTLAGTCFADENGKFRYRQEFFSPTALADARAWIDTKFGVAAVGG